MTEKTSSEHSGCSVAANDLLDPLMADANDLSDGASGHASSGGVADRLIALGLSIAIALRGALTR